MSSDALKTVALPLALMIVMFGMGLSLTVADFKRVILAPKAKLVGLANQLLLLPSIAFGLVALFGLSAELAGVKKGSVRGEEGVGPHILTSGDHGVAQKEGAGPCISAEVVQTPST